MYLILVCLWCPTSLKISKILVYYTPISRYLIRLFYTWNWSKTTYLHMNKDLYGNLTSVLPMKMSHLLFFFENPYTSFWSCYNTIHHVKFQKIVLYQLQDIWLGCPGPERMVKRLFFQQGSFKEILSVPLFYAFVVPSLCQICIHMKQFVCCVLQAK